jgi:hypothetical protein
MCLVQAYHLWKSQMAEPLQAHPQSAWTIAQETSSGG